MSLAVAIWESPTRYTLAADSRVSTHIASVGLRDRKLFRVGDDWFGAWAGTMVSAQRFMRALREPVDDDAIRGAWEAAVSTCPPPEANCWRSMDVDVLLVGPPGVVRVSATGAILRPVPRESGTILGIIGCADEYVMGWMDCLEAVDRHAARRVIRAACEHYPGVGAPVEEWARVEDGVAFLVDGARADGVARRAA